MKKHFLLTGKQLFILLLVLAICITIQTAQAQKDISGSWQGSIDVPGNELDITIDFSKTENGWTGSIDISAQNAVDLPLANIKVEGEIVTFDLPNVPGNPSFSGSLSADNQSIAGNFTQSGQVFPFQLERKTKQEIAQEQQQLQKKLHQVRAFVDTTMKSWDVPGMGLVMVQNNKVILSDGFGMRNIKENLPVTENTLFAIGSCTKAFTTMVIGQLVDDGKLKWDEPVRTYLPSFTLKDEFATERMTPRDLVTHRSGLPRHDLMWYNSSFTRKEIFDRLQYLQPNKDFRTTFQYQNLMFMTAGYLAGRIEGSSWERVVQERIFNPLGMSQSNFSIVESQQSADFALPYRKENEKIKEIPFRNIDTIGPAGSINSTVHDLSNWLLLQLSKGKVTNTQLISELELNQMHTPYMAISVPQEYTELSDRSYGLGWFIDTYRGHKHVSHGGNIDGFTALVSLYPNDNFGLAILSNLNGTPLPTIIDYYIADVLLDMTPVDWNARIKAKIEKGKEQEKKEKPEEDRVKGTKPSHKLADYAGTYQNPGYGNFTIQSENKQLTASFNGFTSKLEHWHYDVFRTSQEDIWDGKKISFLTNMKGDIERLSIPLEPQVDPIIFTRIPPQEMMHPSFLAQFVGNYDLSGETIRVELKGKNMLMLVIPGQPAYELEPYKGNEFNFKELSSYSIEFKKEKDRVTELLLKQPNGVFTAKRKE